jgi:hypothetical protein
MSVMAMFSSIDKGVPSAILQGQVNQSNSRMEEENITLMLNANKIFKDKSYFTISSMYKNSNTIYVESPINKDENRYLLNDFILNLKYN